MKQVIWRWLFFKKIHYLVRRNSVKKPKNSGLPLKKLRNLEIYTKHRTIFLIMRFQPVLTWETSEGTISLALSETRVLAAPAIPTVLSRLSRVEWKWNTPTSISNSQTYQSNSSWLVTIWRKAAVVGGQSSTATSLSKVVFQPKNVLLTKKRPKASNAPTLLNASHILDSQTAIMSMDIISIPLNCKSARKFFTMDLLPPNLRPVMKISRSTNQA